MVDSFTGSFFIASVTILKILETNSSFYVKQGTTEKVQFLFFSSYLLILTKFSFWNENRALGYNSIKFQNFLDVSLFPKILNLKLFDNSWGNSDISCLLLTIALLFTCGEKKIRSSIKISQNIMNIVVCKIFYRVLCLY